MKVEVLNIQGEKTGRSIDLPDDVFGIEPNEHSVYLSVKQYLANQRQGTHKAKERSEVAGSTRKIKRQKGTGTARAGDIKSPLFRGGGRVFGPRPRNYSQKLNKKLKRLAKKSALSGKLSEGKLFVIEDFSFDSPKTKEYMGILARLDAAQSRSLLVTSDYEKEVYLSSRNLKKSEVVKATDLNTYQILLANSVILSEGSIETIVKSLN